MACPKSCQGGNISCGKGDRTGISFAKETLLLHWVIGYFLLLAVWRVGVSSADYDFTTALGHAVPLLVACGVACAILMGVSWFQARSSVYTLHQPPRGDAHGRGPAFDAEPALYPN